jgi:protein SCO1/2
MAGLALAGKAGAAGDWGGRRPRIADVAVRTQDGRAVHFYSDLIKGRVVALNFIFTGCSTVCPLLGAGFASVQKQLGRQASEVGLVSVSLDPENDTPARLSEWSARFGAKPGWTLVTGAVAEMNELRASLGASAADPAAHTPLVIVIDDRHGRPWQRLDGLADPALIAKVLLSRIAPPRLQ